MSLEQSRMELERRQRMTVKRGYIGSTPVLVDNQGRAFDVTKNEWNQVAEVCTVPGTYYTWSDVPFAWINGCPYWK